jgi:hypothetical protein
MKTVTCNLIRKNKKNNNTKTVTINVEGISQGQWSTFLLELNLMKKAWRPYGVDVILKAHLIKKVIEKGTTNGETLKEARQRFKSVK